MFPSIYLGNMLKGIKSFQILVYFITLWHGTSCSAKPAQVGADYPRANDRTIFWPMLAHTADRQQLGSSPGFTFQEVGVCVVPMNQEETRSLEIFDIVYSSGLLSLGVPGVPGLNIWFFSRNIFKCSKLENIDESNFKICETIW